jgi:hypothetical protein
VQGGQRRLLTYGGGQRTISARFYLREASLRLVRACLSLGFLPTLFWRPLPPFPPPSVTRLAIHPPVCMLMTA